MAPDDESRVAELERENADLRSRLERAEADLAARREVFGHRSPKITSAIPGTHAAAAASGSGGAGTTAFATPSKTLSAKSRREMVGALSASRGGEAAPPAAGVLTPWAHQQPRWGPRVGTGWTPARTAVLTAADGEGEQQYDGGALATGTSADVAGAEEIGDPFAQNGPNGAEGAAPVNEDAEARTARIEAENALLAERVRALESELGLEREDRMWREEQQAGTEQAMREMQAEADSLRERVRKLEFELEALRREHHAVVMNALEDLKEDGGELPAPPAVPLEYAPEGGSADAQAWGGAAATTTETTAAVDPNAPAYAYDYSAYGYDQNGGAPTQAADPQQAWGGGYDAWGNGGGVGAGANEFGYGAVVPGDATAPPAAAPATSSTETEDALRAQIQDLEARLREARAEIEALQQRLSASGGSGGAPPSLPATELADALKQREADVARLTKQLGELTFAGRGVSSLGPDGRPKRRSSRGGGGGSGGLAFELLVASLVFAFTFAGASDDVMVRLVTIMRGVNGGALAVQ